MNHFFVGVRQPAARLLHFFIMFIKKIGVLLKKNKMLV